MQNQQNQDQIQLQNQPKGKLSKGQQKKLRQKRKKQKEAALLLAQESQNKQKPSIVQQKQEVKKGKKGDKKPNAAALLALKAAEKRRLQQQQLERQRIEFEKQQKRLEQQAAQKQRLRQEQLERVRAEKRKKKKEDKLKGIYISENNKLKAEKMKAARQQFQKIINYNNQESEYSDDQTEVKKVDVIAEKIQQKIQTKQILPDAKIQLQKTDPPKQKKKPQKKQKTLEQIYAQAIKEKQEKLKKQKQQLMIDDWTQVAKQQQKNVVTTNTTTEVQTQIKTQIKEIKVQKPKKPKKLKNPQVQDQPKKQEPQSKILKNQKLVFQVDKARQFRSPICCILGHVDTGKTTLLDKIRHTNVQQGQAGGITQQIGATFFPENKLSQQISKCNGHYPTDVNVPGLLIIDTPGHQSFANLRSRGSSLCDIAILVIDLMHGLQNQTIESIELLRQRGTPFVVALNKIDRTYDWKSVNDDSSYLALKRQQNTTLSDYNNRLKQVIVQMNQKGYNTAMYWENEDPTQYVSLVPTSGVTGEGIPDLLSVLVRYCLTLPNIKKRVKVSKTKFNCTVMEVKMIEGHGTTIDCILVDGTIKKDDQIVLLGFNGPIVTKVKALLTPHPMKQMRIKDQYLYHDQIKAANGVKISAPNLDQAVAGTPLLVANTQDQVQTAMDICQNQYENIKKKIKLCNLGVGVAASTLGSLQALLDYLNKQKIPVSYVSVGPVSKDDVLKAMKSLLSQNPEKRRKQYCCLLVFDVKVLADAQKYAQQNDIRIFTANIIYHLTDHFNKFVKQVKQERKLKQGKQAVFPCILKQVATFRKNDPLVLGVDVQQGVLKVGTPICVYNKDQKQGQKLKLGVVESIESNHKKIKQARKVSGSVAIQIGGDPKITSGRDFLATDKLVSLISRKSIDLLKEHFRDQVSKQQWQLIIELKNYFKIS